MSTPARLGVVGGGQMGAGIAHVFLVSGSAVTIVETSRETADSALDRARWSLSRAHERGKLPAPVEDLLMRLTVSTTPADLVDSDLVVEAVPEDPDLKRRVLGSAEEVAGRAWFATNTSALSVDELAAGLSRPERLLGLHFFNPVPASALVEVVVGVRTAAELVERAHEWVAGLDKTAVTVTDSPGFASSRLGVAIALEAMRMLQDGVASAEDIDAAMTLGYKHAVGPLRTTDLVGLDVRLAVADYLSRRLGPRFDPPDILRRLVADGHLGRKTGQGFYRW